MSDSASRSWSASVSALSVMLSASPRAKGAGLVKANSEELVDRISSRSFLSLAHT